MRDSKQALAIRKYFQELIKHCGTSITGHVISFDPITQLASLQIGVNFIVDDEQTVHDPIIQCPVQFAGSKSWSIEHELNSGDEGLIIFTQRCIDGWIETGGTARNPILRFLDMQDACFIPGVRSKPNAITGFANDGVRIRDKLGTNQFWMKSDSTMLMQNSAGASVTLSPAGAVVITSTAALSIISPVTTTTSTADGAMSDSNGASSITKSINGDITIENTQGAKVEVKSDGSVKLTDSSGSVVNMTGGNVTITSVNTNGVNINGTTF